VKKYSIPDTPRFKIMRPNEEIVGINEIMQARYTSSVGQLLYLIKLHSYCANIVIEVSKCTDSVTMATCKEMTSLAKQKG
jgi:hypothetical protein